MKVAIISGKGGSGKSSVSAAFVALSEQVVAVDCDVDASNLPILFSHNVTAQENFVSGEKLIIDPVKCIGCNLCVEQCAFDALKGTDKVPEVNNFLCEGCDLCVRICPSEAISIQEEPNSKIYSSKIDKGVMVHGELFPGDDNSGKMIARIRTIADSITKKEHFSLQILDGPPGIGCPVLSTVTGIDRIVIVSEPTLSGISDLERAYRVGSSFCDDIMVVINKCDINDNNRKAIGSFCEKLNIPIIAEIPFDRRLVEAQLHCESIVTYAPESVCAQVLKNAYAKACC